MESDIKYQVFGYRWAILGAYMFISALTQVLWINFAAINSISADYYSVTTDDIDFLSLIFMLVYIVLAIPSAWVIDTKGFKIGAGIGAVLTGVFGFLRIFAGTNFTLVFIFQAGIAIGQPFVLNAVAKIAAQWFPEGERAIATGIGSMAMFLGILLGMLLPPLMYEAWGFETVLIILGILALAGMVVFIVVAKEKPEVPPGPAGHEEKTFVMDGIKKIIRNREFVILMVLTFIGLGSFNAIATWIESIVAPKGYGPVEAGTVGGLIVIGGIVGALVITTLADKYRKRKIFLIIEFIAAIPLLFGIAFITDLTLLSTLAFLFGFFFMPALPIALEYAAEQMAPVPEGTTSGILMMMGQVGGVIFIVGFLGVEDLTPVLVFLAILLIVVFVMTFFLKEEPRAEP